MIDKLKLVTEFQESFKQIVNNKPCLIDEETAILRYKLMEEENDEYLEAMGDKDLVGVADALGDQLYILCGTILTHGMQHVIEKVFNEIHLSNMSKLDLNGEPIINGKNGYLDQTRAIGKVLKPEHYFKPNLKQFF